MTDYTYLHTKPEFVSAQDAWSTVLMLVAQVEQGRDINSALSRIEMTIANYRRGSHD
jgi:hypothetical protein